jgi:hypothetical protein
MQTGRHSSPRPRARVYFGILAAVALPALLGFAAVELRPAAERTLVIRTVDYAFQMPDRIEAGLIHIRLVNGGTEPHHVYLIKLPDGKTTADLLREAKSERLPDWAESVGGPNTPGPGGESEAIVALEPGNYVAICVIPSHDGQAHVMKGMLKPFTVVGRLGRVVEPRADVTVELSNYDFGLSHPLTAGSRLIRFENRASQDHEMLFVKLAPGKRAADFLTWVQDPQGPPPVFAMGGVTPFAPGRTVVVRSDLSPGTYALYCFVNAKDGKSHIAHGMMKEIRVEAAGDAIAAR